MTTETLTEEQKMAMAPGIIFVGGAAGRRPRIAGSGPDVWEVINAWRFMEGDFAELQWYFSWVPEENLRAALRYHELFREEIDAWIEHNDWLGEELRRTGPWLGYFPQRK
jgi:uncharacterized protein (DUF433 family)